MSTSLVGLSLITLIVLTLIFVLVEVYAAVYIGRNGQPRAVVTMVVMAVMGLVMGIPSAIAFARNVESGAIMFVSFWLLVVNWLLLVTVAVHDLDHMRQAVGWKYTFTTPLLAANCVVYVPNMVALCLSPMTTLGGAIATMVGSALVVIAFLRIHFLGTSWQVWGPWCKPFWELGVDRTSWWVLWLTATVGLAASAFGGVALGLSA